MTPDARRPVDWTMVLVDTLGLVPTHRGARILRALLSVLERGNRADDFVRAHDGAGVVRDVDLERGVHVIVRVTGGRVLHHRDLVAELGGETHRRLHAGVRD